ncbi:uncharacterized protein CTHT_0017230 [Thermochaetoides thermophila DSM 1495]|uniref:Nucleolar protein 9 n=1 Tax=Chaetomium thermophilum (strain DSM 1495 / CBS 144.50 / IMI 039719) TaxID=759272 RepID=G0S2H3_CHATD|nr:hypothetical protein CTHT_0017230 [Thermochaetoides thermophila DSM 1495]EGS22206.1 hypothetical protein CTHT_0017230 [Thermochaetoides thermophila DSM 1495]
MGKNRKSKRQLIRDEKRAKKRERELAEEEERQAKRQRRAERDNAENTYDPNADYIPLDDDFDSSNGPRGAGNFQREFFGMLGDQEQEYFRHADEMLELNDFPTPEDRALFLQNVYREARGKELKLASSQSCSRLMERLILLSSTAQKKRLFGAFAGHFMTLITHRFASHCCEKLFLMSAPVVTQELSGSEEANGDVEMTDAEDPAEVTEAMKTSMEDLFLLTLDELEEHLSFLLSDRYGSHALRVLLVVLSGRPLDQAGTKSLLQSKNKEHVTVEGAAASLSELTSQPRPVPASFTAAIEKIIADSTASMDATALRVLAKHPTGNPTLQLLLELELTLLLKYKKGKKDGDKDADEQNNRPSLLERLLPGAPASLSDEKSQACEFVNGMIYDPIGSRLLETLIAHCPGKVFKGLNHHVFGPRIQSFLRNDIASYPAIKVLTRLGKDDLVSAVEKCLPEIPTYLERGRLNVIKTFFERCHVRGATAELSTLLQALTKACGNDWKHIVPKLCLLDEPEPSHQEDKKFQQPDAKNRNALITHGSQIVSTLLSIPGQPSKAIQTSLLSLNPEHLLRLATSCPASAAILSKALSTPAQIAHFHKLLVANLVPNIFDIATSSSHSSAIVNAIISTPSRVTVDETQQEQQQANKKGNNSNKKDSNSTPAVPIVPFHLKENIMAQLERRQGELRSTWLGRNVWRTWRGDIWSHRRPEWVRWAKETDPEDARVAAVPKKKEVVEEGKGKEKGKAKEKRDKVQSGEKEREKKKKSDERKKSTDTRDGEEKQANDEDRKKREKDKKKEKKSSG